jgi:hypothetical protein
LNEGRCLGVVDMQPAESNAFDHQGVVPMPYKGEDKSNEIRAYYGKNPGARGYLPPSNDEKIGRWLTSIKSGKGGMINEREAAALRENGFENFLVQRNGSSGVWTLTFNTPRYIDMDVYRPRAKAQTASTETSYSVSQAARAETPGTSTQENARINRTPYKGKSPADREVLRRLDATTRIFNPVSGPSGPSR